MWRNLIVGIENELSEYGFALRKPASNHEIKELQE